MTISTKLNAAAMLADYEAAPEDLRDSVQAVMAATIAEIEYRGLKAATDDRAAELEAVIFNFIRESN
jgi:hypothetical protein